MTTQVLKAQDDSIQVRLVTFFPGSNVYELYGHSEIRVTWNGNDWYFNYGVFDFNAPGFAYRFVTGEADYMCVAVPQMYAARGMEGRKMVEQKINLTPEQAARVRDFLVYNTLPENCTYRYQYLGDNCATRPRDIIEKATDGTLHYPAMADTVTYRDMLSHYNRNYPWQQFGIDLVLGSGLDTTLDYRQQMFIPMVLMSAMDGATVEHDGKQVPAVSQTQIIQDGSDDGTVEGPTPWPLRPLTVSLALLALVVGFTAHDFRRKLPSRWLDTSLCLTYGAAGLLVFFLIFVSQREATSPNFNALWVNPFYLLPLVLMYVDRAKQWLRRYHVANALVIACTLAAWPLIPQVANPAFFPLMLVPLARSTLYIAVFDKH